MTILGIETATAVCGAALVRDGAVVAESRLAAPQAHSERLLVLIDEVLARAGVRAGGLDAIACSIGPGSFTGLRIGLSVAKGLAFATGAAIVPVSTLEALAARAVADGRVPEGGRVLAVIDARRDEVYAALYQRSGEALAVVAPGAALAVAALAATLDASVTLVGDGSAKMHRAAAFLAVPPAGMETCSPGAVALVGAAKFAAGARGDLASLEPDYVKEFYTTAVPLSQ
jgi:tRNA threonylcarbamoyladenosine biosynthesis protein TsaB